MGVALKLRRGTTTELNAFQGVSGEMVMDTTTNKVYVFDTASPPVKQEVGGSGQVNTYNTSTNELTLEGVVYTITSVPVTSSIDTTGLADEITIGSNTLALSPKASLVGNILTVGNTTVTLSDVGVVFTPATANNPAEIEVTDTSGTSTFTVDSANAVITNTLNYVASGSTFPTNPSLNDLFITTTDNKLYRWTGSTWESSVQDPVPSSTNIPTATGNEIQGQLLLVSGDLYAWSTSSSSWERLTPDPVQLAADIAAVGIQTVTTLPTANLASKGDVVILQSDGKLYRCIEPTANNFVFEKSYSFDDATGQIIANQITAGTITASHLGANSVTAGKILAGEVQTAHMGANSIAGDRIAAGTLSANKIDANGISANYLKSGTSTVASGISFGLGSNISLAGRSAAGAFTSSTSSKFGLLVTNTGGEDALAVGATGSSNNAVVGVGKGTSASFTQWESLGALGSGSIGGVFHHYTTANVLDNAAELATPTHAAYFTGDIYYTGNITPFTGSHEALIDSTNGVAVGDIVVDIEVITRENVSNTLCKVALSSESNQKGAVGIYVKGMGDVVPSSLTDVTFSGDGIVKDKQITTKPEYESLVSSTDAIHINSVGEGQVNVCGEGGNLEIGDLIVTSSLAGKGKKQGDDIIRSTTVAKVRENISFSSSTEVKQIACIYLCG